jgi:hypothetical protein
MSRARDIADQVRAAGTPAEAQAISDGLSPAERAAVVAELERDQ